MTESNYLEKHIKDTESLIRQHFVDVLKSMRDTEIEMLNHPIMAAEFREKIESVIEHFESEI